MQMNTIFNGHFLVYSIHFVTSSIRLTSHRNEIRAEIITKIVSLL